MTLQCSVAAAFVFYSLAIIISNFKLVHVRTGLLSTLIHVDARMTFCWYYYNSLSDRSLSREPCLKKTFSLVWNCSTPEIYPWFTCKNLYNLLNTEFAWFSYIGRWIPMTYIKSMLIKLQTELGLSNIEFKLLNPRVIHVGLNRLHQYSLLAHLDLGYHTD